MSPIKNLTKGRNLRPDVRDKLFRGAVLSGPLALVLVMVSFCAIPTVPEEPDVYSDVRAAQRATDWGRDYFTLWMAGTDDGRGGGAAASLEAMTDAPGEVALPRTGYGLRQVDVVVDDVIDIGRGDYVWRLRASALVVPPGSSSPERMTFTFDAAEHVDGFRATAMPRPISSGAVPFTAVSAYTESVDANSRLYAASQNFASAYLTPDTSKASLGTAVTSDFEGGPLARSLWSTADVTAVNFYSDADRFDLAEASTGDTVHALITVKASSSSSTFSMIQLPVEMEMQANGQWAVVGFDEMVYVEDIEIE